VKAVESHEQLMCEKGNNVNGIRTVMLKTNLQMTVLKNLSHMSLQILFATWDKTSCLDLTAPAAKSLCVLLFSLPFVKTDENDYIKSRTVKKRYGEE